MIDNPMCQAVLKQSCQLALTDLFESGNLAQLVSETICRVNTLEVMPSGTYTFDGIGIRENSFAVDGAKWQTLDEVVPSSIRRFGRRSLTYHAISSRRILMGKIWICKANISLEAGATPFARRSEVITTLIFHPAAWFMRMGFRYGLEASFSPSLHGFRFDFKTARAVPDDSLIFELCERGDLIGVRRLMERGDASVYDRNSKGWTPLHVSTVFLCRINPLIEFLIARLQPLMAANLIT